MAHQTEPTSVISIDANTRLSYERTSLAHERTLMAWVRTATSLITFGFTIYKFFELERRTPVRGQTYQLISARDFAMIMIAIGLFGLVLATIQNWQYRKSMKKQHIEIPFSLSLLTAGLISALGLLAMVSAAFRW